MSVEIIEQEENKAAMTESVFPSNPKKYENQQSSLFPAFWGVCYEKKSSTKIYFANKSIID